MRTVGLCACAFLGVVGWGRLIRADSTIDVPPLPPPAFALGSFGGATAGIGQTFTTGTDRYLSSFEFYGYKTGTFPGFESLAGATFIIAPWNGTAPGGALFSAPLPMSSTVVPLIYNASDLALLPNSTYIAYASCTYEIFYNDFAGAPYAGGIDAETSNNGAWATGDPTANHNGVALDDLAFKAVFVTNVPEPATLGLLGISGVMILRRRRPGRG